MAIAPLLKSAFAARVGISPGRVTQLIKKGLPVRGDGKIDPEAGERWLAANLDHGRRNGWRGVEPKSGLSGAGPKSGVNAVGLKSEPNEVSLNFEEKPRRGASGSIPKTRVCAPLRKSAQPPQATVVVTTTDDGPTFADHRREREQLKVERERLSLERDRRELVPRADVVRFLEARGLFDRDAHLSWVARTAARLSSDFGVDATKLHAFLESEMRAHLIALAETPIPEEEAIVVRVA